MSLLDLILAGTLPVKSIRIHRCLSVLNRFRASLRSLMSHLYQLGSQATYLDSNANEASAPSSDMSNLRKG